MLGPWKRPLVLKFIKLYREQECLWRVKSEGYYDRYSRNEAYDALLLKLQELMPEATKDVMLGKIRSLRTAFRKENVRIIQSMRQGARGNQVYKPRIWYYNELEFLAAQEGNEMVLRPQSAHNPHLKLQTSAGSVENELTPNTTNQETTEMACSDVTESDLEDDPDPPSDLDLSPSAEALQLQCHGGNDLDTTKAAAQPSTSTPSRSNGSPQKNPRPRSRPAIVTSRSLGRQHAWGSKPYRNQPRERKPVCIDLAPESDEETSFLGHDETRERSNSNALFGQYVARCLCEMTEEQSTHAQTLMFDVIYEGKLKNLSRQTHLVHET